MTLLEELRRIVPRDSGYAELGKKAADRIDELERQVARCKEDARRWQHALEHGFPVRNQTAFNETSLWVAQPGAVLGATPNDAIDKACNAPRWDK